jgi:hypothetical protein
MIHELKECPFCGAYPMLSEIGNEHTHKKTIKIKCPVCRVQMVNSAIRYDFDWLKCASIDKWNRRADYENGYSLGYDAGYADSKAEIKDIKMYDNLVSVHISLIRKVFRYFSKHVVALLKYLCLKQNCRNGQQADSIFPNQFEKETYNPDDLPLQKEVQYVCGLDASVRHLSEVASASRNIHAIALEHPELREKLRQYDLKQVCNYSQPVDRQVIQLF